MAKVAIVTDSGSGITLAEAKEMGIGLVSIPFMFGDNEKTYFEDINLTRDEFFDRLKSGETVHTSGRLRSHNKSLLNISSLARSTDKCTEIIFRIHLDAGISLMHIVYHRLLIKDNNQVF